MATHSSILAWRIPWTEGPGRLQSMGLRRVRHNRATSTFTGGTECRGHAQYSAFALRTLFLLQDLKWQLGFFWSLYLLSRICPNRPCMPLFLAPYSFLVFCCLRRGMSRREHRSKGPEVSACLSTYLGWEEEPMWIILEAWLFLFRPWRGCMVSA